MLLTPEEDALLRTPAAVKTRTRDGRRIQALIALGRKLRDEAAAARLLNSAFWCAATGTVPAVELIGDPRLSRREQADIVTFCALGIDARTWRQAAAAPYLTPTPTP